MASIIVAQLLFLENQGSNKPIHIYINSPGGGMYLFNIICTDYNRL